MGSGLAWARKLPAWKSPVCSIYSKHIREAFDTLNINLWSRTMKYWIVLPFEIKWWFNSLIFLNLQGFFCSFICFIFALQRKSCTVENWFWWDVTHDPQWTSLNMKTALWFTLCSVTRPQCPLTHKKYQKLMSQEN